jgi:hypothetical protein
MTTICWLLIVLVIVATVFYWRQNRSMNNASEQDSNVFEQNSTDEQDQEVGK